MEDFWYVLNCVVFAMSCLVTSIWVFYCCWGFWDSCRRYVNAPIQIDSEVVSSTSSQRFEMFTIHQTSNNHDSSMFSQVLE